MDLLDDGNADSLREHLANHPGLVHQRVVFEGGNYFRDPTLLEFSAGNPVRHDSLPPNIVEVAKVILDASSPPLTPAISGVNLDAQRTRCTLVSVREWAVRGRPNPEAPP